MKQNLISPDRNYTLDQYIRLEEPAEFRHEFRNGQITERTECTIDQAGIITDLLCEIANRIDRTKDQVLGSDLRVRVPATNHCFYPDIKVICGKPLFNPRGDTDTLINPHILIEVASPETEADDLGDKRWDYFQIESLQEYFVVCENRPRVFSFYRENDGIWRIGPTSIQLNDSVVFRSVSIEVPMADIYVRAEFATST